MKKPSQARESLISTEANKKALGRIESAIIVVALDDTHPSTREEAS